MEPTSTLTRHAQIAARIHEATPMPLALAGIAAAYAMRPPDELLGRYNLAPHELYQCIANYLALPAADRPATFIMNSRTGQQVPVTVLGMSGFDVNVDVGGTTYDFDATNGEFCLGTDYSAAGARAAEMSRRELLWRTSANREMFGNYGNAVEADVAKLRALLAIPPDLRPEVVIYDRVGLPIMARLIDERRGHVLLEIERRLPPRFVFDLQKQQLSFKVSDADAAAHARYAAAMANVGMPFPLHDKA